MTKLWNEFIRGLALILSIPKSLIFNLHYFPPTTAMRLPVLISYRVKLRRIQGKLTIKQKRFGCIKIGFNSFGMATGHGDGLWDVTGHVHFMGKARIGCHPIIQVQGSLHFGENFDAGHNLKVFCRESVRFGDNVLISWNVEIMDNDGHKILNMKGEEINAPKPVAIDNHCWLGSNSSILKGTHLPHDCIVASRAVVSGPVSQPHCIVAGSPAKPIRHDITWEI